MITFSARLKAARKMMGYSLQDVSDLLNNKWNKQYINRLETGEKEPDIQVINALAKALNVTIDYFLKKNNIELEGIQFRKLKKLPNKEQEKVIYKTKEVLERYLELEDHLGLNDSFGFKIRGYKIKHHSQIEDAVVYFREKLRLGNDAIYKVTEMLESLGIKVIYLDFNTDFSGMSTIIEGKLPVIVLNDNKDIPIVRKRFTALHELAHILLDLSEFGEKEEEKLCDRFASAILLPKEKIKEYFGNKRTSIIGKELQLLGSDYGIAMSAILYRCKDLGIVTESYHKYFMINYNKFNMKEKEKTIFTQEEKSDRFLQLLLKAIAEEVISLSKAASLNNMKLGEFRALIDNL